MLAGRHAGLVPKGVGRFRQDDFSATRAFDDPGRQQVGVDPATPPTVGPFYYRTSAGAQIDLLLELPGSQLWAIEIKRSPSPKIERGFHIDCDDLQPVRRLVVYAGTERVPLPHGVEAVGLSDLAMELVAMW